MPGETMPPKESDVRQIKIVYLKNAEATAVQSIVYDIFGADVTPGVDRRTNALILSGPAAPLNEALALVDKLDTADPAPTVPQEAQKRGASYMTPHERKMRPAERRVGELLEEHRLSLRGGTEKATIDEEHVESLREAIAAAFDERQAQQLAEIEELSTRLQKLSQTVRSRQTKRQQMIERRLSDLLNPENQETTDEDPLHSDDKRLPKAGGPFVTDEIQKSVYSYGAAFRGVLYFRADWVAPCKEMDKTIERLQSDGAHIETINIDEGSEVVNQFKVDVIPSLVFIREGKVHRIEGLTSYEKIRAQFDPKSHEFRPSAVIASPDSAVQPGKGSIDPVRLTEVGMSLRRNASDVLKQMKEGLVSRKALQSARKNDVQSDVKPDVRLRELEASLQGYSSQAQDIKADAEIYLRLISQKLDLMNVQLSVCRTRLQTKQKANEKLPGAFPASELGEAEAEVAKHVAEVELLKTVQEIFTTASSTATEAIDLAKPQRDVDSAPLPDPFQGPNTISSETSGNSNSKGSGSGNQLQVSPDSGIANESTESLFQSVMRLSSRAEAIKADLNGETGELRKRPKDDPRAIEVREQLNVGLAQIRAQAAEYQKFVASAANLAMTRLDNARSDLDRHRQLSEQGIVPVSELRKSEEALAEAEAAFKQLTQIQEVLSSITASAADAQGREY